jgi:hypothetical protein
MAIRRGNCRRSLDRGHGSGGHAGLPPAPFAGPRSAAQGRTPTAGARPQETFAACSSPISRQLAHRHKAPPHQARGPDARSVHVGLPFLAARSRRLRSRRRRRRSSGLKGGRPPRKAVRSRPWPLSWARVRATSPTGDRRRPIRRDVALFSDGDMLWCCGDTERTPTVCVLLPGRGLLEPCRPLEHASAVASDV